MMVSRKDLELLLTASAMIAGCAPPFTTDKPDYFAPQSRALIVISDPQVYTRASLINDRSSETRYLQQLLDNSAVAADGTSKITFSPQIIRDLKSVDAISAAFALNAGTTAGSSSAQLNQQIANQQLQAQLDVLKKQTQAIQDAAEPMVTIPAPSLSSVSLNAMPQASGSNTMYPDLSAQQTEIKALQTQLNSLATSIGGPTAPSNVYTALEDPRDDFVDRQAYRTDIRAALAEARLDDVHDRGGDALYRLQFQATIFPRGTNIRQWGAAKVHITEPQLSAKEVASLYYGWLGDISAKLNASPSNFDYEQFISALGVCPVS